MKALCTTCGRPLLKGGGLDKLCGACLFEGSRRPPAVDLPDRMEQEEVAMLFPELEILEPLGRGGMGVVWRARQKRLDREVALKLLRPELADEPGFAERFQREARALAKLSHPNVVVVHDFGEERGRYYLLMEYVKGVGLRDLIRDGRLTPSRVLEIVPEICSGLQYAHENGVVHRDIKPENILIDGQGHVRIADFGLAKLLGSDAIGLTRTSQVMGTYEYMSPEQIYQPLDVDHRADVYSLGVVLYEMLTGDLPRGRFASPSEKMPMDVRLDDVVARALQEERESRYQSVEHVKDDVEEIARTSKFDLAGAAGKPLRVPREAPPLPSAAAQPEESDWMENDFVAKGSLDWVKGLKLNADLLLLLCMLGGYLLFAALMVSARSTMRQPTLEAFGLCYPFAWLAMRLLRSGETRFGSTGFVNWMLWILALAPGLTSLALACNGINERSREVGVGLSFIACIFLIIGHSYLERGIRRRDLLTGALALVIFAVAALIYAIMPGNRPSNGLAFFLGMPGILCGASLISWLPSVLLPKLGLAQRRALLTLMVVGLSFAFFYFVPLVFN